MSGVSGYPGYICICKDDYVGNRCEHQVDTTSTEAASTEINEITGGTILYIEGTVFKLKPEYSTPVNVHIYWDNAVEGEFDWTFTSKREDVSETNFKIYASQCNFSFPKNFFTGNIIISIGYSSRMVHLILTNQLVLGSTSCLKDSVV